MSKSSLGTRLFISHLLATIVGLGCFALAAKLSSPKMFVLRLEQLEKRGNGASSPAERLMVAVKLTRLNSAFNNFFGKHGNNLIMSYQQKPTVVLCLS